MVVFSPASRGSGDGAGLIPLSVTSKHTTVKENVRIFYASGPSMQLARGKRLTVFVTRQQLTIVYRQQLTIVYQAIVVRANEVRWVAPADGVKSDKNGD